MMYCEKDTLCKLCPESLELIKKFQDEHYGAKTYAWFKNLNGYIMNSQNHYIHQAIMNCFGNGKGTSQLSVDHLDRNPLNNTKENLRIATRKEQEHNSSGIMKDTKKQRRFSARKLPDGLSQDMLKKYVVYYEEFYDKEKTKMRQFFKVESHPLLQKEWISSKSANVSLIEKLNSANQVAEDLEKGVMPPEKIHQFPPYYRVTIFREKPHLIYERRVADTRINMSMVLPENFDPDLSLSKMKEKLSKKYPQIDF